jgi:hypothetical protein
MWPSTSAGANLGIAQCTHAAIDDLQGRGTILMTTPRHFIFTGLAGFTAARLARAAKPAVISLLILRILVL